MSMPVQELIHKYELGSGNRVLKLVVGFLALVALAVVYDANSFRTLTTPEGMDAAQLARNIAEGKGYTTDFIRPFSVHLMGEKDREAATARLLANVSTNETPAPGGAWKERHPDLANPPLYPLLLAGVLKLMPFGYPDLLAGKSFSMYLPDLWISGFNQLLLIAAVCLVFRLARRLFDEAVAWISASVFAGTELFWRFSLSGNSTLLLVVIFLGLVEVLSRLEEGARQTENPPSEKRLLWLAAAAGALVGLGMMTRYAFGWLCVPLTLWLGFIPHKKQVLLAATAVAVFAMVAAPWTYRNYSVSGTLFGTAGYAAAQYTSQFPEGELDRSLEPDFSQLTTSDYTRKLWSNGREMMLNDLPRFGGNWVWALFLVGLLVPFRNPILGRIRVFVLLCLGMLFLAQALGRTSWTKDTPELNTDNLLILAAPMTFILGISLLATLLESTAPALRSSILTLFFAIACAPLISGFFSPHPLVCFPPWIQDKAARIAPGKLVMSDVPWAVAWYGQRQSVWLPLKHRSRQKAKEDFYALQEKFKPVSALYLTSKTLNTIEISAVAQWIQQEGDDADWDRFVGSVALLAKRFKDTDAKEELDRLGGLVRTVEKHWIRGGDESWASFLLGIYINREVPTGFPLRRAPLGLGPEIFLTDSERKSEKAVQSSK